ncbi:tetratricopeptide repeat protein [Streptomyces sp. NBC_00554]|uniref:tetratricopeptide repeat protein n=1 Tax=Streptomyces sp. NBC_00554 TaxID=2903661 RepID=UPI00352E53BB|nr:tetratricopeptide repeat protein [Streptomyces sp. NBC_00554]
MVERPGRRRTQQGVRAQGDVTQVAGDLHIQMPSMPGPKAGQEVEWPVWVGRVPRLAAAFQSRAATREAVDDARADGSGVILSQVLAGDGGVGKSQLAASLARELRDREDSGGDGLDLLVWVNATEPDQIIAAYAKAAEQLGLQSGVLEDNAAAADAFLAWLAVTERRWLVVLDDITDPEAVDAWWPDGGHRNGWVLATTRRHDALLSGQGRKLIHLDLYTPEEARAYLRRRLTDAGHPHLYDTDDAEQLAMELGYLPLALGHAAAYTINKRCTTGDYLTLCRDTGSTLSDLLPENADTEGYGRPVTTALLLSLPAVEDADSTRLARPLLEFISLMDPIGHPAALWTTAPALQHLRNARPGRRRWLRRHQPAVTEAEVRAALECLRNYALIAQDTDTAPIRMHALTARALRETPQPQPLPATARAAAEAIMSLWPALDHHDRELSAALRANSVQLDMHTRPALWQPTTHACIYKVSASLRAAGLYNEALEYDLTTVQRSVEILGPDHTATLTARNSLATSYSDAGRNQEALELAEQVLIDRERSLGPDHPAALSARSNVAMFYREAGHPQKALELAEQVLADYERSLGPDHFGTVSARHNLAVVYRATGRTQEAFDLCEQVLAGYERNLGPDHPAVLTARNNLTNYYNDVGRTQEALQLAKQVLTDHERVLGPDHPFTLRTRNTLVIRYNDVGRTQEALQLAKQALTACERVLGPDHPYTLEAGRNLATSYNNAGRTQEALQLAKQVLTACERILGTDHPDTLEAGRNLATSYNDVGRTQEALQLAKQVLTACERVLGPDHPDTRKARKVRNNVSNQSQDIQAGQQPSP